MRCSPYSGQLSWPRRVCTARQKSSSGRDARGAPARAGRHGHDGRVARQPARRSRTSHPRRADRLDRPGGCRPTNRARASARASSPPWRTPPRLESRKLQLALGTGAVTTWPCTSSGYREVSRRIDAAGVELVVLGEDAIERDHRQLRRALAAVVAKEGHRRTSSRWSGTKPVHVKGAPDWATLLPAPPAPVRRKLGTRLRWQVLWRSCPACPDQRQPRHPHPGARS